MPNSKPENRLKMSDSAIYEIRIQGYLEEIWADRLGNMEITPKLENGVASETKLVGKLKDQAELIGVLNGLYEMRVPILFVSLLVVEEIP